MKVSKIKKTGWTALVAVIRDPYDSGQQFYQGRVEEVLPLLRKRERGLLESFLKEFLPLSLKDGSEESARWSRLLAAIIRRLRQPDWRKILTTPPVEAKRVPAAGISLR